MLKIRVLKKNNGPEIVPIVPESGNTRTDSSKGVKKQISPSKRWCFTYNNYIVPEIDTIDQLLSEVAKLYIFEEEIGEGGTPHLQGYVEFLQKCRPCSHSSLFQKFHWEKARSSLMENILYCSKDYRDNVKDTGIWIHGCKIPKEIKIINPIQMFPWQIEILEIINNYKIDRSIYWFWEAIGGIGKTEMCRYLAVKHDALILGGKAADMKYAIAQYFIRTGFHPELVIFDIPRTSESFLSYSGLEEVKNALFFSNKYESGQYVGNPPCVIVFANFEPDVSKMSTDRWVINEICNKK